VEELARPEGPKRGGFSGERAATPLSTSWRVWGSALSSQWGLG